MNGSVAKVGDEIVYNSLIPCLTAHPFLLACDNGLKMTSEIAGMHYTNFAIPNEWADVVNNWEITDFSKHDKDAEKIYTFYFSHFRIDNMSSKDEGTHYLFIKQLAFELFLLVGEDARRMSFVDNESKSTLVKYISNDDNFLSTSVVNIQEVARGLKQFGVRFVAINTNNANEELLRLVYENNSFKINYGNIVTMLDKYYSSIEINDISSRGYTLIMSNVESSLAKYINGSINEYMDVVIENCKGKITDSEKYALDILNNEDIDIEQRITYISYLQTIIPRLFEVDNRNLWISLLEHHKALEYNAENVIHYFIELCSHGFDETLVKFINAKGAAMVMDNCFADDDEQKMNFFKAVIESCNLDDAIYESYLLQSNHRYKEFRIENLSTEKISILDKLNKIGMTAISLNTIREHYASYLYSFICNHLEEYIIIISDSNAFILNEMVKLLNEDITIKHKIELLQTTFDPVSLKDKKYPDELSAYVLENNYDEDDFEYLTRKYEVLGEKTKIVMLNKVTQQGIWQIEWNDAPRMLITDILSLESITLDDRQDIFKEIASTATNDELKKWLPTIGLGAFLPIYEKSKRPSFDDIEINKFTLEVFKKRETIVDYMLDENTNKYRISRTKPFQLPD